MITTANYLLHAMVGEAEYYFEYDSCDVYEALETFWHEDYPEFLGDLETGNCLFPIDVKAMDGEAVICTYRFMFNIAVFHAYFDHGHKADGPYTLDEFARDIRRGENNDVTSFFYYMWNRWGREECEIAFRGCDYNHFWNKWCEAYDTMGGPRGAAELFYMMLSDTYRDKLVKRALECYDGMTEKP